MLYPVEFSNNKLRRHCGWNRVPITGHVHADDWKKKQRVWTLASPTLV